jgi:hypothetical protein
MPSLAHGCANDDDAPEAAIRGASALGGHFISDATGSEEKPKF